MPITLRKFNAEVRDQVTGDMKPAGLLSSDALGAINEAKTDAISAVQAKQTAAETAVENKGVETLASIPQDYTSLDNEVDDLKTQLNDLEDGAFNITEPVDYGALIDAADFHAASASYADGITFTDTENGVEITKTGGVNMGVVIEYNDLPPSSAANPITYEFTIKIPDDTGIEAVYFYDGSNQVGSYSGETITKEGDTYKFNYTYSGQNRLWWQLRLIYSWKGTKLVAGITGIDVNAVTEYKLKPDAVDYLTSALNANIEKSDHAYTYAPEWEVGSIYSNSGANFEYSSAIRTPVNKKLTLEHDATLSTNNDSVIYLYAFKYDLSGTFIERLGEANKKNLILCPKGYQYRFVAIVPDNITITDDTIGQYAENVFVAGYSVGYAIDEIRKRKADIAEIQSDITSIESRLPPSALGNTYAISSDFRKSKMMLSASLGTLALLQSFCIYNNKIYSTEGASIKVQDMSFNVENTAVLSLGHGNAFQLGHNGIAYISGWNDQKVYAVDLPTLTIVDTITLPKIGDTTIEYTTAVVDDVNKYAYIFQRDSYPSTEEYYNFIVYDYDNEQIISTKKTTVAMGAMQACDFIDDKIFVLNGSPNNQLPNGFRLFDTSGNLISEYVIGPLANVEPEGVFVDRSTREIYISEIHGYLYKLSYDSAN